MIFLTIGSHEPFDRLVRAVDEWYGRAQHRMPLFGQITARQPDSYHPRNFEWVERLASEEYAERMAEADLIVSHAGMGSIITALHLGKLIVIMPRCGDLHETRNNHQLSTVERLGHRPGIHIAKDETVLGPVMDHVLTTLGGASAQPIPEFADRSFTSALSAFFMSK